MKTTQLLYLNSMAKSNQVILMIYLRTIFWLPSKLHFKEICMLKEFGTNAVCMDSTHGTNSYDFFLITLLVLDDLGEGVPVCWIISNREDAAVIRQVLLKVKEKCGDIETRISMNDDANNFYNAWRGTFSVNITKKLLCAWHLDKSFRGGLQKHISSRTKQVEVYH